VAEAHLLPRSLWAHLICFVMWQEPIRCPNLFGHICVGVGCGREHTWICDENGKLLSFGTIFQKSSLYTYFILQNTRALTFENWFLFRNGAARPAWTPGGGRTVPGAHPRARTGLGAHFCKVLCILALCSEYTWALAFENFYEVFVVSVAIILMLIL
jgi:hypothetical protein